MKDRITAAINAVNGDMLRHVWEKFSYRLGVVCAVDGGHIEHLQNMKQNLNLCIIHVARICNVFHFRHIG